MSEEFVEFIRKTKTWDDERDRFDLKKFYIDSNLPAFSNFFLSKLLQYPTLLEGLKCICSRERLLLIPFTIAYNEFFPKSLQMCYIKKKKIDEDIFNETFVGYQIQEGDKVLLIDKTLKTGNTIRKCIDYIRTRGGMISGILVAINKNDLVREEIEKEINAPFLYLVRAEEL